MWTLIRLALGALVLLACVQAGRAAFNNYQFEDAVGQAILFAANVPDAQIVTQVLEIAAEYNVPLEESGVTIRRERRELFVDMEYEADVPLIPGVYAKRWTFKPRATARLLAAP